MQDLAKHYTTLVILHTIQKLASRRCLSLLWPASKALERRSHTEDVCTSIANIPQTCKTMCRLYAKHDFVWNSSTSSFNRIPHLDLSQWSYNTNYTALCSYLYLDFKPHTVDLEVDVRTFSYAYVDVDTFYLHSNGLMTHFQTPPSTSKVEQTRQTLTIYDPYINIEEECTKGCKFKVHSNQVVPWECMVNGTVICLGLSTRFLFPLNLFCY